MDYRELNDNELIYLSCENNEEATTLIIKKYKNCILNILKEYLKEYNIVGVEVADLYQEGLIGLMNAIQSYNPDKDVLFYTYANACIRANIISAIRQTFRQKNRILNQSYSLDKIFDDSGDNYYEVLKDDSYEPNKLLLNSEEEIEIIDKLKRENSYDYILVEAALFFEEHYEEFCDATGSNYGLLQQIYDSGAAIGQATNRKLMRDLRIYMAVGGMPQAVEAYVNGKNFSEIDMVKRQIISLYEEDFKKIDASGRISALYHAIPAQLAKDARKYRITTAIGKRNNTKAEELLYELIDSKTVLPCYNSTNPRVSLTDTKDFDSYKLYLSDTGLFVTLMFIDRLVTENDIYAKLLSDKLPANLGYLYENLVAQMITASGRELYYHTWEKKGSTHYYEVDFLISEGSKINAFEVKSSGSGKHESIREFRRKFSQNISKAYLISQKEAGKEENLLLKPFYLLPFLIK